MGYLKFRTYLDRCRVCGSKTVLEDSEYPQVLRICTKCIMNEIPKIEEKERDRIRELESSNDDLACDNDNLEGKNSQLTEENFRLSQLIDSMRTTIEDLQNQSSEFEDDKMALKNEIKRLKWEFSNIQSMR